MNSFVNIRSALIFALLLHGIAVSASVPDSLIKLLKTPLNDTTEIIIMLKISEYYADAKPDSALYFAGAALEKAIKARNHRFQAEAHRENGWCYYLMGNFAKSIESYFESLRICEQIKDEKHISASLGNIGSIYKEMENYDKAEEYYLLALQKDEMAGNKSRIASGLSNLGILFMSKGNYGAALDYYNRALSINKELQNEKEISIILNNIGNIYVKYAEPDTADNKEYYLTKALDFYYESLTNDRKSGRKTGMSIRMGNIGNVYLLQNSLSKAEHYLNAALALSDSIGAAYLSDDWHESLSRLYEKKGDFKKAHEHFKKYIIFRDSTLSTITAQKATQMQMNYEFEKIQALQKAEQAIMNAEIKNEERRKNTLLVTVTAGLLIALVFSAILFGQKKIITKEKQRSEKLLLNILPEKTARELKAGGKVKPGQYASVTVLFTDFKEFTKISEELKAEELVDELNNIFSGFDRIIAKYPAEKIKTIGDSYMCAGGIPVANDTHHCDMVDIALEFKEFIDKYNTDNPANVQWKIRIGLHTGPVVAGVVGLKKFAYDIWGDTVNTASRMESGSVPDKINISETTYGKIKDNRKYKTEYRGELEAKNKGNIKMYFVERETSV